MGAMVAVANTTSYNSDDILDFAERVLNVVYPFDWSGTIQFVIGYYTPRVRSKFNWEFVRTRSSRVGPYRIGIVQPERLYSSPLARLAATVADEHELTLLVKRELASSLIHDCFTIRPGLSGSLHEFGAGQRGQPIDDSGHFTRRMWEWIETIPIRFSRTQKRDAKANKQTLMSLRLSQLERARNVKHAQICRLNRSIESHQTALANLELKIEEQRRKIQEFG